METRLEPESTGEGLSFESVGELGTWVQGGRPGTRVCKGRPRSCVTGGWPDARYSWGKPGYWVFRGQHGTGLAQPGVWSLTWYRDGPGDWVHESPPGAWATEAGLALVQLCARVCNNVGYSLYFPRHRESVSLHARGGKKVDNMKLSFLPSSMCLLLFLCFSLKSFTWNS